MESNRNYKALAEALIISVLVMILFGIYFN